MLAQKNQKPISIEQGEQLAKQIKAKCHMTCSAKGNIKVAEIFEQVIRIANQPQKKKLCG